MIKMSLRPLKVKAEEKEKGDDKGYSGAHGGAEDMGNINNYK